MSVEFEFIHPDDKPALLALSTPEWVSLARAVLTELGYKVHTAQNHEDFQTRFNRILYQVIILEECFAASTVDQNLTLRSIQTMGMSQRRHATFILLGDNFQSLNPMQAFQQSVHAVVNRSEIDSLSQIIQQVVSDNDLFLNIYRDTQLRIAQGKA
jgi:hypothetical protein